MPSRPSPPTVTRRKLPVAAQLLAALAAALAVAFLATGCATSPPAAPRPPAAGERAFLLPPSTGDPLTVDPRRSARLSAGYQALIERGDTAAAGAVAQGLLAEDPGLHAAGVLLAESRFVAGDLDGAATLLRPLAAAAPAYTACQAALGAVEERRGNLPEAFEAYHAVVGVDAATERADALRAPAAAALSQQVVDAAAKSRVDIAAAGLARLRAWAPDLEPTLDAERAVAQARGDRRAELVAVRRLAERRPADRALREQLGRLEAEAGDPAAAIQIFESLLRRDPGNPALLDELADARFRWRLELVPARVREATGRPQVTRAELAQLLFWLVPDVRYGHPTAARIATDVLDREDREEIVRVVNLGLLEVDETVHRFAPDRGATRGEALLALQRILDRRDARCARGAADSCAAAVACRIVGQPEECLPATPLAGADAVRWMRRALEAVGER